jgi:hypothetical protein
MHGRERVRLFRQDGGESADRTQAGIIQRQFRDNKSQIRDRKDGKALAR